MLNDRLQIQLEKIRQAENEVRWQHEDDVEDCTNCKQAFSVTKRKVWTNCKQAFSVTKKKGMKKPKQVQTNFNQVLIKIKEKGMNSFSEQRYKQNCKSAKDEPFWFIIKNMH